MRGQLLRLTVAAVVGLGMGVAADAPARAQGTADKPIRFIVPFPPGGSTDVVARAMQPALEKALGQTVIVENRPGAGGVLGIDAVAKSAPDGSTIGMGPAGALTINVALKVAMPFDPRKDLTFISKAAESPFILVASPDLNATSLGDVIARAKKEPGTLSVGHGGNGTAMHLTAQMFATMAQVPIGLVPYRGTAPVVTDVIGGHIKLGIVDPPPSQGAIKEGKLKPLAVSSKKRFALFADVPTFDELGLKNFEVTGWFGIVVPAATPREIVTRLNTAVVAALNDPEVAQRIRNVGMEPVPMKPDEFTAYIDSEIAKISKVLAVADKPN